MKEGVNGPNINDTKRIKCILLIFTVNHFRIGNLYKKEEYDDLKKEFIRKPSEVNVFY